MLYATERVVALFAYTAQHSDELSFKKDDIITILERGSDPDWWKGELDGRSGLFPANYIRPLTADCMLLCTPICTSVPRTYSYYSTTIPLLLLALRSNSRPTHAYKVTTLSLCARCRVTVL